MYQSTMGISTVYTSELCLDGGPKFKSQPRTPGLAYVHGAGAYADGLVTTYGNQADLTRQIASIRPIVSGDNGGPLTWGNDLSITRLGGYVTRLTGRSDADPNKYALLGGSMGGQVSINYAAQATVKPKCMVFIIPVININDIVANNRSGYAAGINAAYGGTYSEASQGATHNPYTMKAMAKIMGIPMLIFYGTVDALCLPNFTTDFGAADPTFRTLVPMVGIGHEEAAYSTPNRQQILDFLSQYLDN